MRFLVDEDLSPTLVSECHQAGYDATMPTTSSAWPAARVFTRDW
jgi:hypothetical protein